MDRPTSQYSVISWKLMSNEKAFMNGFSNRFNDLGKEMYEVLKLDRYVWESEACLAFCKRLSRNKEEQIPFLDKDHVKKINRSFEEVTGDNVSALLLQEISLGQIEEINNTLNCDGQFTCIYQWLPYVQSNVDFDYLNKDELGVGIIIRNPDQLISFETGPGIYGNISLCHYVVCEYDENDCNQFVVYASVHFFKEGPDEPYYEDIQGIMGSLSEKYPNSCIVIAGDFGRFASHFWMEENCRHYDIHEVSGKKTQNDRIFIRKGWTTNISFETFSHISLKESKSSNDYNISDHLPIKFDVIPTETLKKHKNQK